MDHAHGAVNFPLCASRLSTCDSGLYNVSTLMTAAPLQWRIDCMMIIPIYTVASISYVYKLSQDVVFMNRHMFAIKNTNVKIFCVHVFL